MKFILHLITRKAHFFFTALFSKHFWRELWLDTRALFTKSVSAEVLETLCGYVNPSYSDLVAHFQRVTGQGGLLHDKEMVKLFYTDREKFFTRLKSILSSRFSSVEWANSLYEGFKATYGPIPSQFTQFLKANGLDAHIRARKPLIDSTLDFRNIKVEGVVNLTLGGSFSVWLFRCVEFCDTATVSIYPPFFARNPSVSFYKNVFHGDFKCLFAFAREISIIKSKFKHSVIIGADTMGENNDAIARCEKELAYHDIADSHTHSTVKFSGSRCESLVTIYNRFGEKNFPGINMVRFEDGNIIGGLSIPESVLANVGAQYYLNRMRQHLIPNRRMLISYYDPIGAKGISNFHFDINEHIKMPHKEEAPFYKIFFIGLKNKAIETHDREAEFNYGRKERYFDRAAAPRRQDRFILWWSHLVSDGGISWIRPSAILLGGQCILAAFFIGWLGGCCDYAAWFQAAVESLNPLSSLPEILKSLGDGNESCKKSLSAWENSLTASIYNAVRRIFSLALIYEIVKVFLRFSNKLSSG